MSLDWEVATAVTASFLFSCGWANHMTNEDRVLECVRRNTGKNDDELSALLKIMPRQQVNQICRRLEARGALKRTLGPQGKIVNAPSG